MKKHITILTTVVGLAFAAATNSALAQFEAPDGVRVSMVLNGLNQDINSTENRYTNVVQALWHNKYQTPQEAFDMFAAATGKTPVQVANTLTIYAERAAQLLVPTLGQEQFDEINSLNGTVTVVGDDVILTGGRPTLEPTGTEVINPALSSRAWRWGRIQGTLGRLVLGYRNVTLSLWVGPREVETTDAYGTTTTNLEYPTSPQEIWDQAVANSSLSALELYQRYNTLKQLAEVWDPDFVATLPSGTIEIVGSEIVLTIDTPAVEPTVE